MNNTALAVRTDTMEDWQIMRDQAMILLKSNFLPQAIKTAEQALAIILTGRELGIGAMQALNTINVIAGKPTVSPQLMLALINSRGQLEDMSITDDGQACTVRMKRRGRTEHAETFSMKDAALMKTTDGYGENKKTISLSEKYNWRQMPAVMRKWRAVAACARVVFPDVILGLYTPDEMGAHTDVETGEVVEAQAEQSKVEVYLDNYEPVEAEAEPKPERDPRPRALGDLVTPKQLWMIRNLGREIGADVEAECMAQYTCPLEEISKRTASEFIDYLKSKGGEIVEPEPVRDVRPEGAQNRSRQAGRPQPRGTAGQIFALTKALGWDDKTLAGEIHDRFEIALSPENFTEALATLPHAESQELIQALKAELESRNRTK